MRKSPDLYDWDRLERLGAATAEYAMQFRNSALAALESDGVDVRDAAQVLIALRRTTMGELEQRVDLPAPREVSRLEPWKASHVRALADRLEHDAPRLNGLRVVLAVLEVHDLVRDALARVLPAAGAEVILLGASTPIEGVVRAAADEDADVVVIGVYNGNALAVGERLVEVAKLAEWNGQIFMGGILNQDTGEALPIDARPELAALGIRCVERVEDLLSLLTAHESDDSGRVQPDQPVSAS